MDKDLRRLVMAGLGLLVLLFVGRIVIGSLYDDSVPRAQVLGLRRSLSASGEAAARPDPKAKRAVEVQVRALDEQLQALAPQVAYELRGQGDDTVVSVRPEEFDVPTGASPDLRYIEVLRREQEELVQGARFIGKTVPLDLGMPVPNPTGLEDVLGALRSLHVVHLVVSAALDADVEEVSSISVPPVSRRRRAESGFLKTHRVEFELRGTPAAVRDTLHAVTSGEPYLALDDVRLEALDDEGELVRCRFFAVTVTLDLEQPVLKERSS